MCIRDRLKILEEAQDNSTLILVTVYNNALVGSKILADSGLNIVAATSLVDAAEKAVQAAGDSQ